MNLIQTALLSLLPSRRRQTPSGWTGINAVCCHHRGQKPDQRGRGGVYIKPDGGWTYHCFNCQFKAGYTPGHNLSANSRNLFSWLGLSDSDVQKLNLEAIRLREQAGVKNADTVLNFDLQEVSLPDQCTLIEDALTQGSRDPGLLNVIEYIVGVRGMEWGWYPWHWSAAPGYRDRVIIPFYQDGKIVGWTGRKITDGKPRYLTTAQPGYVFNLSAQPQDRQYLLVHEGQFDAIALDSVAVMASEPSDTQCARIQALGREVIAVPDRDEAGLALARAAVAQGWSVSFPDWEPDVKDAADAVKRYGRVYTLLSILRHRTANATKAQIKITQLEYLYEKQKRHRALKL